jgi:hypothetical protein
MGASAGEWKPVTSAELEMKAPLVDKTADAEAIFWEVRVLDELKGGYLETTRNHYLRIKLFTERAREHAKVELTYLNKMNVTQIAGRTIKPDGRAVEMKRDAVFDTEVVKGRNLRVRAKTFTLPDVQPGDVIEYQWTQSESDAASNYMRLPLQRDIPVETVLYLIKPLDLNNYPNFGMKAWTFHAERVPMQQMANGFTAIEYHNMAAFREEPDMAPEDELRSWLLIYYADNEQRKPETYWPGIGKSNYAAYQKDMKVNGDAKKIAAEAVASAKTDEEKARAIYAWVRKNVKNVFTEASAEERRGFKENRSSADTLKQGLGTGYDINIAFATLCEAAGLNVRMARTGDRSEMFFNKTYTDPYFLRGTLVAIKIGGEWKYYDPASTYLPFGFQPWQQQASLALITDGKNPEWSQVPLSKAAESQEAYSAQLKLDAEGGLSGSVRVTYTGHLAASERAELFQKSAAEREQYLLDNLKAQFGNPAVTEVKWDGIEDAEKAVTVSYKLDLPNYVQKTGKRIFVQPAIFEHNLAVRFPNSERTYPLYFHFPWSEVEAVTIEVPPGYEFDHPDIPPAIIAGNTVSWKASAQIVNGNQLAYKRTFQFGDDGNIILPPKAYPSVKKIFDAIHDADEHTIALKQAAPK